MNRLLLLAALLVFAVVAHADNGVQWLTYPGGDGPGKGKRIVLIAADQEYRSEESMPMMAKILSKHHGFDCTVLFAVNEKGEVDPTMPEGKQARVFHTPNRIMRRLAALGSKALEIPPVCLACWGEVRAQLASCTSRFATCSTAPNESPHLYRLPAHRRGIPAAWPYPEQCSWHRCLDFVSRSFEYLGLRNLLYSL